jgi:hypothetical protein
MIELQKVYVVMKILDDMKFSWFHGSEKKTGRSTFLLTPFM